MAQIVKYYASSFVYQYLSSKFAVVLRSLQVIDEFHNFLFNFLETSNIRESNTATSSGHRVYQSKFCPCHLSLPTEMGF